jgi:hypothetical protein
MRPAVVFATDTVARWSQFQPVGPCTGTSDFFGLGRPDRIMIVVPADQCVGYLMQEGVSDIFFRAVADKLERDGDRPIVIIAASGSAGTVVEFKVPVRKPVFLQGSQYRSMNSFDPILPLPGQGFGYLKFFVGYGEFVLIDTYERTAGICSDHDAFQGFSPIIKSDPVVCFKAGA